MNGKRRAQGEERSVESKGTALKTLRDNSV